MSTKQDQEGPVVGVLDRIRAKRTGRLALRIGIGVLGALVVGVGIVLIPFPGPGWAIVILGLAIWALEFVWAKRLLDFTKRRVRSWTGWIARQSLPVRALIGVLGLIFVAAIVWASFRLSLGIDLLAVVRGWLARR
jgi:uncharacterized protein (TIGR02611 family)